MTTRPVGETEYELVLMIVSKKPEDIVRQILDLGSLAGHNLRDSDTQDIHDIYLDTLEGALSENRLNLRIREKNGRTLVTLKQYPGKLSWKRNARKEIELEWSADTPTWVGQQLPNRGVKLRPIKTSQTTDSPLERLNALGLVVVQDRETQRRTRNIVSEDGRILAELAIDNVTYHFRKVGDLQLSELEIESKSGDEGQSVVELAIGWLAKQFGAEVRKWKSGKLRTGRLIEALAEKGELQDLILNGRLKPGAYDLIARAS